MMDSLIPALANGVLYSLFAIGFALVYNTTRILHVAAAAVYVFAAYLFWWMTLLGLPQLPAGLLSVVLTMGVSLSTDFLVYRPLVRRGASNSVLMVASMGLMLVVVSLLSLGGYSYKSLTDTNPVTGREWQIALGGITILAFLLFIGLSGAGLRLRAFSDNPVQYETLGYSTNRSRIGVFAGSGFFIAMASCLNAYAIGGIDVSKGVSYVGMNALVNALVAMILGGTGRYGSCVVGGFCLALIQALLTHVLPSDQLRWQDAFTFLLLILLLLIRPQGLVGRKQRDF